MGNLKVVLILSNSPAYRAAVARGRPYRSYAPLSLTQLAALAPPEMEIDFKLVDLTHESLPPLDDADLIGISSITCGINYAYSIADRERARGKTVVIGGSHATALPEEAEAHADAVVVGYAERSWPRLLRDWRAGRLQRRYIDFADPFTNSTGAGPIVPRRDLNPRGRYLFNAVVEASRGCPNACGFCATSSANPSGVVRRPLADIAADLDTLGRHVLFLDSNFTENHPPEGELFQLLAERGAKSYAAGTLKLAADPKRVALAAKRGLSGLLVGFESLSAASMAAAGKSFNSPAAYEAAVRIFHDHGIKLLGCFVFGLDGDDDGVFERTVEFAERSHIDIVRFSIATPLPGTTFRRELEAAGRIIDRDWDRYDTEHVVFRPALMTPDRLQAGLAWTYEQCYRLPAMFRRLAGAPPSLLSWAANLGFKGLAGHIEGETV